jgi:arabinosaccharide transport system substrate-binding protein
METGQALKRWQAAMDRLADWFPFGKAPFIILLVVLVSGGWLLVHPIKRTEATLRFWTFADTHYYAYLNAKPSFEAAHPGRTVDLQFVHGQAVTTRLRAAFWANLDVPDMVEVEISSAGSFFRGPPEDIGFEDLTAYLKAEGLIERMVKARFAPYTHRGRIYGLPHDVHPVMLAYRRDLFEELGIDASKIETWDDFVRIGRRVTIPDKRYLSDFSDAAAHNLEMCLFQRGGGYFDADGRCIIDNPIAMDTLRWYIPLVAGPNMIADDPGWGAPWVKAIEEGYVLTFVCPDWRSKFAEQQLGRLTGKMALMPLPAVKPGGRRTSSWGGTMLGITQACTHKDLAWQLAKHLYLNPDELAKRFRDTNILPALKEAWKHEAINEPRPYWSNQPIGRLYAELGDDVPAQYTSPYIEFAKSKLAEVVSSCAGYYNKNGQKGFDAYAESRLRQAADEIRDMMKRNPF